MTWGYDSDWLTGRQFARTMMYSHPHDLLSALYSLREDTKSNNRPIIFLCHSLGGVVVKEALLRASTAIPKYNGHVKAIRNCTKGIIFLGTPQQSTQETSFGQTIGHLFSIALSRRKPLISLAIVCDMLELQLGQFKSICTELSIYYCYERRPTRNSLGVDFVSIHQNASCCEANLRQIISKASATMGSFGIDDSHCVGLDKDHLNMVKYQSDEDPDYKLVLDLVCRLRMGNGWTEHIGGQVSQAKSKYSGRCIIRCSYSAKGQALDDHSKYVARSLVKKLPSHLLDRSVSPFLFAGWLT